MRLPAHAWPLLVAISLGLAMLTPLGATAQEPALVRITDVIHSEFPTISLFLSVRDPEGKPISGLSSASFSVIEDETPLPGAASHELDVGTRQVFALNFNRGFRARNVLGQNRYELLQQALLDWWARPDASTFGLDDLSLVTSEGVTVTHTDTTAQLASALSSLEPKLLSEAPGFDLIMEALTYATDAQLQHGMPQHVIFITSFGEDFSEVALENLIARANESSTPIHVVYVESSEPANAAETRSLRTLASSTNGSFRLFDPKEGLTSLADLIISHRKIYKLTFSSRADSSGPHSLMVRVTTDRLAGLSNTVGYDMDVQPPSIAFIQPPAQIVREPQDPSQPIDTLTPTSQTLRLLVTFPDAHVRSITASWLTVDGQIIHRNTEAPFDLFEWDLTSYLESGPHSVQATVQDALGLESSSVQLPVHIKVSSPPSGFEAVRPALTSLLAALAVLAAGTALAVALISIGRQRAAAPTKTKGTSSQSRRTLKRAALQSPDSKQQPEAFLIPLNSDGSEGNAIPLTGADLMLGRDPAHVATPIADDSVSGLHAKIIRRAAGEYLLRDQGSVAGTWVNYEPIPKEGRTLRHEDLVHLGRVALRFRFRVPPPAPDIRVRPHRDLQAQAE